ncbi:MAG: ECF transporter S component [Bacillota bacterium]|nr:ECF transporter S component [Bacillota bacterium]
MAVTKNTKRLTQLSLIIAIELIVGLVPYLGYIPVNPALNITIMHIPVIIAAVVLGPKAGGEVGFVFGLTSLINATFLRPNPIESPIFSPFFKGGAFNGGWGSVVICFVPRILVGVVAGYVFILLFKGKANRKLSLLVSGVLGSLTNTILVLGGIYIFFREPYAKANGMTVSAMLKIFMSVIGINGMLEAAVAAVLTLIIADRLLSLKDQNKL